jgi:hypothetical protein
MANVLQSSVRISLCCLWIVVAHLCLFSGQRFSPFPVRTLICDRPGSADAWIMIIWNALGLVCLNCIEVHLAVWIQDETLRHGTDTRIGQWRTFIGRRHFCPDWQLHRWQWHTSRSGLTIQAVDILYVLPTSLRGIPASYDEQSPCINTVAHWVFLFFYFFFKSYKYSWLNTFYP